MEEVSAVASRLLDFCLNICLVALLELLNLLLVLFLLALLHFFDGFLLLFS